VIVLCVNAGSSNLKVAVYDGDKRIAKALVFGGLDEALRQVGDIQPQAVGHRIVHGGPDHHEPSLLDDALIASLRSLVRFAPLHLPPALDAIETARRRFPSLPQVACFDTHFHWQMPERARRLPLPDELYREGVRRYGFHGLSYEFIVSELGGDLGRRTVIAHLGNGASLAAVSEGRCVDTTMAFTPAAGVVMGTRPGDLDPGVVLYLLGKGLDGAALEKVLTRESGMRGISGGTSEMRELLERRARDTRAALAVEMFTTSCRKAIGSFATVLGGLDMLVFTGGIGENAAEVRAEVCKGLEHLGIVIDLAANAQRQKRISTPRSTCAVLVVPTDEDRVIARHTTRCCSAISAPSPR
jgi:acetate kinase